MRNSFVDCHMHIPVLQREVLSRLAPENSRQLMVDATVGEGGHAELFLSSYSDLRMYVVDADAEILQKAKVRLKNYSRRVIFFHQWFNHFFKVYDFETERPDIILFDLGISSDHYEAGRRGFSFRKDEPLDMRLNQDLETSAADIINNYPEEELASLFYEYGEERYSRRIAAAILSERDKQPITGSKQLADLIYRSVPPAYRHGRIHPGTRTFQALRIAVNGELARLKSGLEYALKALKPGGKLGVISFHSLEDRKVKNFFRNKSKACICPSETPICRCGGRALVKIVTKKPIRPQEDEVAQNPPSRSARFRVVIKLRDEE